MSMQIINSTNSNQNQNNNENEGGKVFTFRFSWGLMIAILLAVAFAVAGGFTGYYMGTALESLLASSSSNTMLSSEVMSQFHYDNTSQVLHAVAVQNLNTALSIPTVATYGGSLLGAVLGFLLGLLYEKHQSKNKTVFE